jgi:hypothetical protein
MGIERLNKNLSAGDWEIAFSLLYPIFHGKVIALSENNRNFMPEKRY